MNVQKNKQSQLFKAKTAAQPENRAKEKNGDRLLAESFPMLSKQPGLPLDIRNDLALSDKKFGGRHKRGKNLRLELLENMENRLELDVLRHPQFPGNMPNKDLQHGP